MAEARRIFFLAVNVTYAHSNLAAWCLRSYARETPSWDWHIREFTVRDEARQMVSEILAHEPRVLAATLYLFNRDRVLTVLRACRELGPGMVIVVGGPECLGDNQPLLAEGVVDVAVRGEGERALAQLLHDVDDRSRWNALPGVCWMDGGRYHDGGMAEPVAPLDAIPPFYEEYLRDFARPFVQLETSRGCDNSCAFCTSADHPARYYSLPRVRADLQAIRAAGVRAVRLVDRTFNADRQRALALLRLFREEFPELKLHLEIDPARLTRAFVEELNRHRPGRFHVEAGVQALSPQVYRAIGRRAGVGRTLAGVRKLCECPAAEVHVDLLAGLPQGTLEGLVNDIRTLVGLRPTHIQLERVKVLPGTRLDRERDALGLSAARGPPYQVLFTPHMSGEDLERADRLSRLLDWFYNAAAFREIVQQANAELPDFWAELERDFAAHGVSGSKPGLEERFRYLHRFLAPRCPELGRRIAYAWLRRGLSPRRALCPTRRWAGAVPEGAKFVEGNPQAPVSRLWLAELDGRYLFAWGPRRGGGREVVAVWKLADQG